MNRWRDKLGEGTRSAPPGKLWISLFSDLKDVRLSIMVVVVGMITMIKRKKNVYQMLHSWPTERLLLNSGYLSPHTALGKGMLASPCVLVQVSLLTVSLSPVVPGWAPHLSRVWCQEPVYNFTSRKNRLLLFSHLEPGVVNTLTLSCRNSLCKSDVESLEGA